MRNSTLLTLCLGDQDTSAGRTLRRDQFGLHRIDEGDGGVSFHLPTGLMVRLVRECGLQIDDLIEVGAPKGATSNFDYADLEWARRWPSEEVWKLRKA